MSKVLEYIEIYKKFFMYNGIPINKIELNTSTNPDGSVSDKIYPLYSPAFKNGISGGLTDIFVVNNLLLNGKPSNWGRDDFKVSTIAFINQLNLLDKDGHKPTQDIVDTFLKKSFTWHHDEGTLDQMVLIPKFMHRRTSHWGAGTILLKTERHKTIRDKWKSSIKYIAN